MFSKKIGICVFFSCSPCFPIPKSLTIYWFHERNSCMLLSHTLAWLELILYNLSLWWLSSHRIKLFILSGASEHCWWVGLSNQRHLYPVGVLIEPWHYGRQCPRSLLYFPLFCLLLVSSVMPDSLWPFGLLPARLLCPWDSPGKNTGVGCHFLLQGIFPPQGSNPCFLHLLH